MKVFDSSVYVSAFLGKDKFHVLANEIIESNEEKVLVPYIVFAEVSTVLTYQHSRQRANDFATLILQDERFTIIDAMLLEDINSWQGIEQKISFADVAVAFTAQKYNAELVTFDKQQQALFKRIK